MRYMFFVKKQNLSETKTKQRLRRNIGSVNEDYQMIKERNKIMVCLSGGKDFFTLLKLLTEVSLKASVHFETTAFYLD